jgi:hypothetical protein
VRLLAILTGLAIALGIALALVWRSETKRPTLAQLAAGNYRTLSARESRKLVQFANAEYRCLVAHGTDVSAPVATRTRITMNARNPSARELAQAMMGCDPEVGPPPSNASLQARANLVLVYLPKRCLLDPDAGRATT